MNYKKQCWFCGKEAMEPKGSYHQCRECGATWNEQPKLTSFMDIETHLDGAGGERAYRPVRKRGTTLTTK